MKNIKNEPIQVKLKDSDKNPPKNIVKPMSESAGCGCSGNQGSFNSAS